MVYFERNKLTIQINSSRPTEDYVYIVQGLIAAMQYSEKNMIHDFDGVLMVLSALVPDPAYLENMHKAKREG